MEVTLISEENKLISKTFSELRELKDASGQQEFLVFNFNTRRKIRDGGIKGFCDLFIANEKTGIHFIEVKLTSTKDAFSPLQKTLRNVIGALSKLTPLIHYWVIQDLDEAFAVYDFVLHGENNILN